MVYVKTVTYSILFNGKPCGLIQPSKGIKQGDLLSPFLFLLCTKGLNGLIKEAEMNGDIHGFSFLQMIVFSFAGQHMRNVTKC